MPRHSDQHSDEKRQEIIRACAKQYAAGSFKDVTIRSIAEETSLSRPSIYNYFQTKEEIFLALLNEEYVQWIRDLNACNAATAEEFARYAADSLGRRRTLLRMQAMNIYEIEDHSRAEFLVSFKCSFKAAMDAFDAGLARAVPQMSAEEREEIGYCFFPMLNGLYPYVCPTAKQSQAMHSAGMNPPALQVEDLVYRSLKRLLGIEKGETS